MKQPKQLKLPYLWEFTIQEKYLHSVDCSFTYMHPLGVQVTQSTTSNHPAFDELRSVLDEIGLVYVSVNSVNGDVVNRAFKLNGYKFNEGDCFPCAGVVGRLLNRN